MSYIPSHLEFLNRSGTYDGWPKGIDEDAKTWATEQTKKCLKKYGQVTLQMVADAIFDHNIIGRTAKPACFHTGGFDYQYAVAHRALLAAGATSVWVLERQSRCV
jgi:hypothetical protein